jgi:hypothetical protein
MKKPNITIKVDPVADHRWWELFRSESEDDGNRWVILCWDNLGYGGYGECLEEWIFADDLRSALLEFAKIVSHHPST